jgi:hypothetical protein
MPSRDHEPFFDGSLSLDTCRVGVWAAMAALGQLRTILGLASYKSWSKDFFVGTTYLGNFQTAHRRRVSLGSVLTFS